MNRCAANTKLNRRCSSSAHRKTGLCSQHEKLGASIAYRGLDGVQVPSDERHTLVSFEADFFTDSPCPRCGAGLDMVLHTVFVDYRRQGIVVPSCRSCGYSGSVAVDAFLQQYSFKTRKQCSERMFGGHSMRWKICLVLDKDSSNSS